MTETDQSDTARTLAEVLLENNLLSQAQLELAIADQEMNDIPLEEILLVRGWITETKLYEVAPWLKPGSKAAAPPPSSKPGVFSKTGSFTKPTLKPPAAEPAQKPAAQSAASSSTATASNSTTQTSSQSAAAKPQPKPTDLPKEPPQRPAAEAMIMESPINSDREQNLKNYKDVLRKILALEKD